MGEKGRLSSQKACLTWHLFFNVIFIFPNWESNSGFLELVFCDIILSPGFGVGDKILEKKQEGRDFSQLDTMHIFIFLFEPQDVFYRNK